MVVELCISWHDCVTKASQNIKYKMLTNKGYYIPKYLYRRKIELIRQKIIKRKYGYLFYRKTVSKILPSQAVRHYFMCLQRKCLKKWVLHWYEERIEWKLVLRAEIHHNLSLQHHVLHRWKYFHIQCKTAKIKMQIAEIHYEKNHRRMFQHQWFYRWKLYIKYKRFKKDKLKFAWSFFLSKYNPEQLRPYFKRWCILTKASKKNKTKLVEADKTFKDKLIFKTFTKLILYTNNKKTERELNENITRLYEKNLKQKIINNWLAFVKREQQEASNMILAETHYCCKLKSNYFSRFLYYRNRRRFIRKQIETFKELQNDRLKAFSLLRLKKYANYRYVKKEKILSARACLDKRLKKNVLQGWKRYMKFRKENRLKEQQLLSIAATRQKSNRLKFVFEKWKLFKANKFEQKRKIQTATISDQKRICRYVFKAWVLYINYRQTRKLIKTAAVDHYNEKLIKLSVNAWKIYVEDEKTFKKKLQEAKDYYQQNIMSESILLIIKAGLSKKDQNLRRSRDAFSHQLFLAQKYFSIWKQNTLYKNAHDSMESNESCAEENKENATRVSNFEWYQICFLTPRVPRNYLEQRFDNS